MQTLTYTFPGGARSSAGKEGTIVGVVGSGQLEVLIEAKAIGGACAVHIETSAVGFDAIWQAVLSDFQARRGLSDVQITINDGGATPAVVMLRLEQAAEEFLGQ